MFYSLVVSMAALCVSTYKLAKLRDERDRAIKQAQIFKGLFDDAYWLNAEELQDLRDEVAILTTPNWN